MNEPLVSVIIPTYNCARYLEEAIDSALAQTYPRVEVVVVDDGSTDNTEAVVRSYGPRVRYVHQANAGTPSARNTGVAASTGELIALLDHDDRWLPEKLALQAPYFSDPTVVMVHGGGRVFDAETGRITSEYLPEPELGTHDLLEWCRVGCATVVLRRSALEAAGPFDPSVPGADDWDMWIRISARGRVLGCRRLVSEIREHVGNQGKRIDRMYPIICRVIEKHRDTHAACPECRSAYRSAKARAREDYYVKTCSRATLVASQGALPQALWLRLSAAVRNPIAALRWPRRIVSRLAR